MRDQIFIPVYPFQHNKYHYAKTIPHTKSHSRSSVFLGLYPQSLLSQHCLRHRSCHVRNVVHHVCCPLSTVGPVSTAATPCPECLDNSDSCPVAHPMRPSSTFPLDPFGLLST